MRKLLFVITLVGCGLSSEPTQSSHPFATGMVVPPSAKCPSESVVLELASGLEPTDASDCECVDGVPRSPHADAQSKWTSKIRGCLKASSKECRFFFGNVACSSSELKTTWLADSQDTRRYDCGCDNNGNAVPILTGSFTPGRPVTVCCF